MLCRVVFYISCSKIDGVKEIFIIWNNRNSIGGSTTLCLGMTLETVLFLLSFPFVLTTIYFGTKGGYYDSEDYKGDGCAHDVKR